MTKEEEAEVNMYAKVDAFLDNNQGQFTGFARLASEISTFKGLRLVLVPLVAKQSEVITGITADKTAAFANLTTLVVKIASKARVFANDANNQALAAVFTITASGFKVQSKAKQLVQAQGVADALGANAAALATYNISGADIAAINTAITACQGHSVAPGAAASGKKAATTAIKNLLVSLNGSLAIMDSLIDSEYADNSPDLVNEYHNNRRLDGTGIRHTGISATFTDAATGRPIENATIGIAALGKMATSNISGLAEVAKMRTGSYHINLSATGYAPQLQDVTVARGRTVELAVLMVKE